jgi:hypothetical protein
MSTIVPRIASGSTNGKATLVVATATAGTLLHTAVTGTDSHDEIFVYAFNSDTVTRTLTIEFGGATAPDQNIVQDIPSKAGLYLVVPGLRLQNGLTVKAFASAASVVTCYTEVNRYTP